MTKFLKNADVTGYISQTSVTSSLVKTDANGKLVAATAGTDYQAPTTALLPAGGTAGQILSKIDATNYNTQWIDNFAQQLKHEVKLGATLTKGTPVYISSANGTNMIVSAASNASETTSSKTLGLLETGGATNDLVKVVTEGLLAGLDTSTALAGDPVWLGPSGTLLYGLANKPVAPVHMVFIGIVTRVQSVNGEIFIKVQNGFELEELHNVAISSVANNQGLFWESATNLWKNKTIATVLGYTPADDAAVVKLTGAQTVGGVKIFTANLLANNPSEGATGEGLIAGQSFKIDGTGTSQKAVMYMVSNVLSDTYASGLTAQYANFAGDKAFGFNLNTAGGFELYVKNTTFNKALAIANTMAATFGNSVTATSFIKSGGTSAQFLKADGSVDSTSYMPTITFNTPLYVASGGEVNIRQSNSIQNGYLSSTDWNTFNDKLSTSAAASTYLPLAGGTLTGALSGTSATFSSSVTATQATFTATANTYAGGALILKQFGGTNPIYLTSVGGYFAVSNGGGADHLLINSSGAATFSGNVTLGSSGSDNTLTVNSDTSVVRISGLGFSANRNYGSLEFYNTDGSQAGPNVAAAVRVNSVQADGSGGYLTFHTSLGTESEGTPAAIKATLDGNGNLGLGVTPSAWTVYGPILQIGNVGSVVTSSGEIGIGNNWYYNSGNKYITTGLASYYQQTSGQHRWFNAPSGTAGASLTFTQAMTLDASGRLGIGTTSPSSQLHVGNGTSQQQWIVNQSVAGWYSGFKLARGAGDGSSIGNNNFGFITTDNGLEFVKFSNLTNADGSRFMTLSNSGNFLIGTTTDSGYKLDVTGNAYISGHSYASIFESVSLGTASAATSGWYKIGSIVDRGGGIIYLSVSGGSYAPVTYEIKYYKNWTNTGSLQLSMYGDSGYVSDARIRQDAGNSVYYIEIYIGAAVSFQVYHQKLLGYNGTGTAFTGTLSAGSASGTTIAQLPFRAYGLSTQGITLAPYNGTSAIAFQRNVSGTMYNYGSVVNSGSDILYQGTGSVFINADSDSDSTSTDREVRLGNRGVAYATLTSDGKLGIGTTSPTGKLHVKGNIYIERSSIAESSIITMEAGEFDINASPYGYNMRFFTGTGGTGSERMRITTDGGVLIGRTTQAYSPSTQGYMLSVGSSSTQALISIAASGQTLGSGGVLYGLDGTRSMIVVRENLPLAFDTNNTERMRITSGGNVLIGTATDAGYKLDVNGTGRFSGQLTNTSGMLLNVGATGTNANMTYTTFTNGVYSALNSATPSEGVGMWSDNQGNGMVGSLYNNNASSLNLVVRASSSTGGLVALKLSGLGGSATFSSDVTLGGDESYLYFNSTYSVGSNSRAKIRTVGAGGGSGYGGDLRFSTRTPSNAWNENAMVINSSGFVGLDTVSPAARLDVNGNAIFRVADGAQNTGGFTITNDGASSIVSPYGLNSSPIFFVNTDTTADAHIAANQSTENANGVVFRGYKSRGTTIANSNILSGDSVLTVDAWAMHTTGPNIYKFGGGMTWYKDDNGGSASTYAPMSLRWITANSTTTVLTAMTLLYNGRLGIGTTSPSEILHVEGNVRINQAIVTSATSAQFLTTGYAALPIQVGSIWVSDSYSSLGPTNGIYVKGNVLIGTTTDAGYKLDVNGTGRFQGAVTILTSNSPGLDIRKDSSVDNRYLRFSNTQASSTSWDIINQTNANSNKFVIYNATSNYSVLDILPSGASTFVSSVTATSFFESSDATIKTLITDNYQAKGIESVVAKLYVKNGKEELGYYAQDVQDILPSAVSKSDEGLLSLSYREVHTAKIARLEKEVEELKAQLARL